MTNVGPLLDDDAIQRGVAWLDQFVDEIKATRLDGRDVEKDAEEFIRTVGGLDSKGGHDPGPDTPSAVEVVKARDLREGDEVWAAEAEEWTGPLTRVAADPEDDMVVAFDAAGEWNFGAESRVLRRCAAPAAPDTELREALEKIADLSPSQRFIPTAFGGFLRDAASLDDAVSLARAALAGLDSKGGHDPGVEIDVVRQRVAATTLPEGPCAACGLLTLTRLGAEFLCPAHVASFEKSLRAGLDSKGGDADAG